MFRIIVALDGTPRSEWAINYGVTLARLLNGALQLVHVHDEPVPLDRSLCLLMPKQAAAKDYLCDVATRLPKDLPVSVYVSYGNPVDELLLMTANAPETILVMATRGRGTASRTFLGRVADKVVRGATVPVLIMRAGTSPPDGWPRDIIVPQDGSTLAEQALPLVGALARSSGAVVRLVRVVEFYATALYAGGALDALDVVMTSVNELRDLAHQHLSDIASRLHESGIHTLCEVRDGRPAQEILRVVDDTVADLIVVASHGCGGVRHWAFGSVADEIVHLTRTPLLPVPVRAVSPADRRQVERTAFTGPRSPAGEASVGGAARSLGHDQVRLDSVPFSRRV